MICVALTFVGYFKYLMFVGFFKYLFISDFSPQHLLLLP